MYYLPLENLMVFASIIRIKLPSLKVSTFTQVKATDYLVRLMTIRFPSGVELMSSSYFDFI